mmetsp:Transcript_51546/g.117507  ORF Transcript_51546/g.117507 Transcript_51546/m.117507 type:complete len:134 (+) Transcript_51546:527-928(+)
MTLGSNSFSCLPSSSVWLGSQSSRCDGGTDGRTRCGASRWCGWTLCKVFQEDSEVGLRPDLLRHQRQRQRQRQCQLAPSSWLSAFGFKPPTWRCRFFIFLEVEPPAFVACDLVVVFETQFELHAQAVAAAAPS